MLEFGLVTNDNYSSYLFTIYSNYKENRENGIEEGLARFFYHYNEENNSLFIYKGRFIIGTITVSIKTKELYINVSNDDYEHINDDDLLEIVNKAIELKDKYKLEIHLSSKQTRLKEVIKKTNLTKMESWKFYNYDCNKPFDLVELNSDYIFKSYFDEELIQNQVDLDNLTKVINLGFGKMIDEDKSSIERIVNCKEVSDFECIVMNKKGEYIGYCGAFYDSKNRELHLEPLCVLEEYRNQGIAKAIISYLYNKYKDKNVKYITGGINEFYSRIGFTSFFRDEVYE